VLHPQGCNQRFRRPRLADRDRVHPDQIARRRGWVEAEALPDVLQVFGLPARAPGQPCQRERCRERERSAVQEPGGVAQGSLHAARGHRVRYLPPTPAWETGGMRVRVKHAPVKHGSIHKDSSASARL
jgi:hypothetical protein